MIVLVWTGVTIRRFKAAESQRHQVTRELAQQERLDDLEITLHLLDHKVSRLLASLPHEATGTDKQRGETKQD